MKSSKSLSGLLTSSGLEEQRVGGRMVGLDAVLDPNGEE